MFYIVFQVLIEGIPLKNYKIHLPVFFISCCLQQLPFFNFLEFHSTFIWKKIPITNFPFFNGFTKTPHPLNAEQLKSAKRDGCCSLWRLSSWVTKSYSVSYVTSSFILYLIVNYCHCLVAVYSMLQGTSMYL